MVSTASYCEKSDPPIRQLGGQDCVSVVYLRHDEIRNRSTPNMTPEKHEQNFPKLTKGHTVNLNK